MNKILIFLILLFLLTPINLSANEEEIIVNDEEFEYFNIEFEVGTQSVWTGAIPLTIYLEPEVDFNRVEVTFDYSSLIDVRYRGAQYFPVTAGEIYKLQTKIYPENDGTHNITAKAIAWEYNTNYTSTNTIAIEIDENLQIVPQEDRYKLLNVFKILFLVLIYSGIGVGIFFVGKKGLKKMKIWLKPDF